MKLGLMVYTAEAETAWNAFRLGVYALKQGDEVKAFLMARGVECEKLNAEPFNVPAQMLAFVDAGGRIYACGTCLKSRQSQGSELCPISTMKDLYEIIRDSDRVISF